MKGLIRAEFRKLFMDKISLILMAVFIGANCIFLWYEMNLTNEYQYSMKDVSDVYDMISGLSGEEQIVALNQGAAELYACMYELIEEEQMEERLAELMSYAYVMEHVEKSIAYPEYLESVSEQAESITQSSLLAGDNSFAIKNSRMLAEIYEKLPSQELSAVCDVGINYLVDHPLTDILFLICFAVLVFRLTTAEREEGYYEWIHVTEKGRTQTFVAKMIVLLIALLSMMLLFYGSAYLVLNATVGFDGWQLPVQSLQNYYHCPYEITIAEFLVLFFTWKILAYAVFFCVIYMVGTACKNFVTAFGMTGTVLAIEYLLWQLIDRHTVYGVLKECNLFAYLDTGHYLETALTSNLFGTPVLVQAVGVVSGGVIVVGSLVLALVFWNSPFAVALPALHRKKKSGRYRISLWHSENKKLFIMNKAALYSILFMVVMIFIGVNTASSYVSQSEYYYMLYSQTLSGELTEEKAQYLEAEQEYIDTYEDRIAEHNRRYEAGEISEEVRDYYIQSEEIPDEKVTAFEKAKTQYEALAEQKEAGASVVYVNESGWRRLVDEDGIQMMYVYQLLLTIFLILCLHDFVCMEDTIGMRSVLNSTSKGKGRLTAVKFAIGGLFGGVMGVCVYILQLGIVHMNWPLYGWYSLTNSAVGITAFAEFSINCPILWYLVLGGLLKMLIGVIDAMVILVVSGAVKKKLPTILGSFAILGIPLLVMLWNIFPVLE